MYPPGICLVCATAFTVLSVACQAACPPLSWAFLGQAGLFVSVLATYACLGGQAILYLPDACTLPVFGLLRQPGVVPTVRHTGSRGHLDEQAGVIAQTLFVLALAVRDFGWTSLRGWPVASVAMLAAVIARPWLQDESSWKQLLTTIAE